MAFPAADFCWSRFPPAVITAVLAAAATSLTFIGQLLDGYWTVIERLFWTVRLDSSFFFFFFFFYTSVLVRTQSPYMGPPYSITLYGTPVLNHLIWDPRTQSPYDTIPCTQSPYIGPPYSITLYEPPWNAAAAAADCPIWASNLPRCRCLATLWNAAPVVVRARVTVTVTTVIQDQGLGSGLGLGLGLG